MRLFSSANISVCFQENFRDMQGFQQQENSNLNIHRRLTHNKKRPKAYLFHQHFSLFTSKRSVIHDCRTWNANEANDGI